MSYVPHERVQVTFDPTKGRTKASFASDCDINQIMRHWRNSSQITHINETPPTYGDFSNVDDYMSAQQSVINAQADFDNLSAAIRDRMHNDPATLIRFMSDPKNHDEAVSLGLITSPPSEPGEGVQPTPAAPEGSPPEPVTGSVSGGE